MPNMPQTPQQMMDTARREAGVDIDDSAILPAVSRLVDSINIDGQPREEGAVMLQSRITRVLKNRLRMARDFAAYPEIHEQKIDRPIFICGMGRTGSTKTQKLLAASGDFNFLTFWKAFNPSLISGDRSESPQGRIDDADEYLQWYDERSPETRAGHIFETHGTEEESGILELSMISPVWFGWSRMDSYLAWLPTVGMKDQFDVLVRTLKYLQWQGLAETGKRWLLKSPLYSGLEPLLLDAFPDACLLMTHRTPMDTIPSGLRLLECFYKPFTDRQANPEAYVEGVKMATDAHLEWRATQPNDRFLDVPFSQLVGPPEHTLRSIYAYADEPLSDASLKCMNDWASGDIGNPQKKYGKHQYSLDQFGLTQERIATDFSNYIAFIDELEKTRANLQVR
jgi:hypothetical protein